MTGITIDANEVLAIAQRIESDNQQLRDLLDSSKSTLNNLSNIWQGGAAQATLDSYNGFASQFFQQYQEMLQSYVTFLRRNVADGYTQTEQANTQLADAFK